DRGFLLREFRDEGALSISSCSPRFFYPFPFLCFADRHAVALAPFPTNTDCILQKREPDDESLDSQKTRFA
ncbi:hypothetical protein, partial [Klebsiella variicola]|uniref:hypothetical protein n=1 Tax=Klebsiella variicola TaxID=244366 RepID=UPI001D0FA633